MTTPAKASTEVEAASESDEDARRTFVWNVYNAKVRGRAKGANDPQARRIAAAARRAIGVEPGIHGDVWGLYRTVDHFGNPISWEGCLFRAEHLAIGLWGQHQQGNDKPMHLEGQNLGIACLALFHKRSKKDAPALADMDDSISRRLKVIARTGDVTVAARHIKSLVNFLGSEHISTDYTSLYRALADWNDPQKHARDLREWASSYQRTTKPSGKAAATHSTSGTAATQKD